MDDDDFTVSENSTDEDRESRAMTETELVTQPVANTYGGSVPNSDGAVDDRNWTVHVDVDQPVQRAED